jgi:hypothetical protein
MRVACGVMASPRPSPKRRGRCGVVASGLVGSGWWGYLVASGLCGYGLTPALSEKEREMWRSGEGGVCVVGVLGCWMCGFWE